MNDSFYIQGKIKTYYGVWYIQWRKPEGGRGGAHLLRITCL